jgi:hypothetical protein
MPQGPYFAIPGEINNHQFVLYTADGTALQPSATLAAGDFKEVTDQGAAANVDTLPTNEGSGVYNWAQSAAESIAGAKVTMVCDDQTATETFLGTSLNVYVYTLDEVASKFYSGPNGPGVYYDSTGGSAGTVLATNGTETDPCSTWANALTVAGELGINRFYITGGSTATLTGSVADYEIIGLGEFSDNTVALASQDCSSTVFRNVEITGTQGGTGRATFVGCYLNGPSSLHCQALNCGRTGTISLSNNDDQHLGRRTGPGRDRRDLQQPDDQHSGRLHDHGQRDEHDDHLRLERGREPDLDRRGPPGDPRVGDRPSPGSGPVRRLGLA